MPTPRRQRQLCLFKGILNKPRRRKRANRPTPCIDRVKNILSGRLRADGCVQLGVERLAKLAAASLRQVKRIIGGLLKNGWMQIVGKGKKGVARTFEVRSLRARKVLAKSSMPAAPHRVTEVPQPQVTNGVTSCIPPHPPCIYPTQLTNKPSIHEPSAEPEFVVFESARKISKATGMKPDPAYRLAFKHGAKAVAYALCLLSATNDVLDRPAWISAALRDGYRHRNDGKAKPAPSAEELQRRREKAAKIIAEAEAQAPWSKPRQIAAPPTIPLSAVIAGQFKFAREHVPVNGSEARATVLRQLQELA